MVRSPTQVLGQLLAQAESEAELHSPRAFTLRESRPFSGSRPAAAEYARAVADVRREFRAAARDIEGEWGPPDYVGEPRRADLPAPPAAREVAYWKRGECVACVYWEPRGRGLPLAVVLAAYTAAELKRLGNGHGAGPG